MAEGDVFLRLKRVSLGLRAPIELFELTPNKLSELGYPQSR
jgi:hypothetical protein